MKQEIISNTLLNVCTVIIMILIAGLVGYLWGICQETEQNNNSLFAGCWADITSGQSKGEWVCVNIKGVPFEDALKTCQHEIGHSIFAEKCETNMSYCLEKGK